MFFSIFFISFRLIFKARFFGIALMVLLVVFFSMLLSAHFGGRQPAAVAMDVGFSVVRLLLPLMIVVSVQELFSREFERRYYLLSLSYPSGRSVFILGRFAALLLMLLALLLLLSLLQILLVDLIARLYPQATPVAMGQHYMTVILFLTLDLFVLAALATLLAIVSSTPSFVLLGTFGFMLVARSYGAIVELLGREAGLVSNTEGYRASLGILGYLLPDLGALDVRMVALYGRMDFLPADWLWLLLSNLAYALALLALATWALQRKRFA